MLFFNPSYRQLFFSLLIAVLVLPTAATLSIASAISGNTPPRLDPKKAITQYMHDIWQLEEGLPQNTVQAIIQTSDGYLWLGTEEGIVRYNGTTFDVFDRNNTPVFKTSHSVMTLFEDSQNTLWIGTNDGLIAYKNGHFKPYGIDEGLYGSSISAIEEDASNRLWVGTADAGLYHCSTLYCTTFDTAADVPAEKIFALFFDSNQVLHLGTETGLLSIDVTDPQAIVARGQALPGNRILTVYEDTQKTLWLGTQEGLYKQTSQDEPVLIQPHPSLEDGVWAIWEDASGSLWLGMSQNGLIRIRGTSVDTFPSNNPLSRGRIPALFEDNEGSLWIGTDVAGLHRLRDGFFSSITEEEGLSNNVVQTILETPDGSIWIGTELGLNRWQNGTIEQYTTNEGLSDDYVTSIAARTASDVWVGTLKGGLNNIKEDGITHFSVDDGLPSNTVYSLYHDASDNLWIGTDKGLGRYSEGRFSSFSGQHGIPSDFITSILEDRSGTLWVGTYDAGLVRRVNDSTFAPFAASDELNDNLVLALHEDAEGILWIGTYGGGLSRLKDGKITNYTTQDGLFNNVVFQILEDDQGNLWMGCNKGVYRISKVQFDAYDAGKIQRLTSISYDKRHGLKTREFTGGAQPAGWKGQDGRLWFPTIYGIASTTPDQLSGNPIPTPIVIEHVMVDKEQAPQPDAQAGHLVLAPGTERLEFKYAALTFISPNKVNYRYRLEGYESEWSDVVSYTHAAYTHLDPGTYTFRVIAQNSEGVWNEEGAHFTFELRPYYYQSPYFWMILVFLTGLLGVTGYRWRISQLTAQQKKLEEAVDQRTHALTQAKEQIEFQTEELRNSLKEKEVLLREVHHRVKNNLQVITSLLNLQSFRVQEKETKALFQECRDRVNSMAMIHERLYQADDLTEIDLEKYLENISIELARSYNADRRKIQLNVNVESVKLGLDQAIPSGLIVNELVSNALKHAFPDRESGRIDISFAKKEASYTLSVADNGAGLPESFDMTQSSSLGMKLVYALTQKLKGTLTVDQQSNTCIRIAFPQLQS